MYPRNMADTHAHAKCCMQYSVLKGGTEQLRLTHAMQVRALQGTMAGRKTQGISRCTARRWAAW